MANTGEGYILIGVEKNNNILNTVGFQLEFNMNKVMKSIHKKFGEDCVFEYGYLFLMENNIFAIKVEKSKKQILLEDTYYIYSNNDVKIEQINKLEKKATLFISYTECDTPIVDIIEKRIHERLRNKIKISRYTELEYKDSFKLFMNTIQDHDFVLTVVSDTYLKRQACMYEVGGIIKDHHYKDKLLFVVLNENDRKYYGDSAPDKIGASIYGGAETKLEYIKYWKDKYDKLHEKMNDIGDYEATSQANNDLKIIGQIYRKDMGEFLDFLSDENGKNFQLLYENDFTELIEWINYKISKDF